MRAARTILAMAGIAVLALSACGGSDRAPQLMNIPANTNGPDEFAILPPKALELPEDLASLPEPAPGGANRTDRDPLAEAVVALGGEVRPADAVPAADGALVTASTRFGVNRDIRTVLATEDLAWRRQNNGRLLERLLNVNVYYKAYADMSLDQHAELWRWRRAGARTPSAPPPQSGEE